MDINQKTNILSIFEEILKDFIDNCFFSYSDIYSNII